MSKPVILVTGANGQLGKEFRELESLHSSYSFVFAGRHDLSVSDNNKLQEYFNVHKPAFCINCAAYTAVDKAETEKEVAFDVNATAVGNLAAACKSFDTKFIHISTDYVFDGQSPEPYREEHQTNPINTYGASKLKGEELCVVNNKESIIIRTAWVYSEFGNNFVKTMLRLMNERESINVVNDQVGAPTYAADLANAIMKIISGRWTAGIFHYSNKGKISWYDFALSIKDLAGLKCNVNPIPSSSYPTPAKRPSFSLLDTQKIENSFDLDIPFWKDSLSKCLQQLKVIHE